MRLTKVILPLFFFLLFNSFSFATTSIHLKNGQMVEGNFLGGNSKSVDIEVSSQTININIKNIAYIIFDKKYITNLNLNSPNIASDSYNSDANEVLTALKVLKSITHSGANFRDYESKVKEVKIIIDEFIYTHKRTPVPNFNKQISDAIGYYNSASMAWRLSFTEDQFTYDQLPINKYCKKCKILQDLINTPDNIGYKDGGISEGILISSVGIKPLWQCAEDSIFAAEKTIKNY